MADKKVTKISDYQALEQRFQTLSVIVSRANLAAKLGMSYNDKRDLYQALGYPLTLVYDDFVSKWTRQDIVRAVVDKPIKATWRKGVQLMESDKADETTFEKEWKDLSKRLKLPNVFARADRLSSFGNYAVLMLGFNDVTTPEDFAKPVQQGKRQLNYVHPYGMKNATIQTWDEDPTSERYGLPTQYQITTSAPGTNATITYLVHFTRIVHIVDDQLESDVEGYCRLEPLYNRFVDLEKLIGGSAEMFWRGARPGYQGKVDENYTMSTETKEDLKNQIDEFEHNLRRILVNQGVDLTSLQQQIADPATHVDIQIQMISAVTGIPKRILVGSERGELSSSQDQDAWFQVIDSRREDFAEPCILRPFVEKCILYGILPEPTGGDYDVEWPDVFEQSDEEKAKVGGLRATALKDYCASPTAESVVPPKAFFEFFLGFEEEDIELIEALVEEGMSAEEAAMKKLGMTPEQLDQIQNPDKYIDGKKIIPGTEPTKIQRTIPPKKAAPPGVTAHSFPGHAGRPGHVGGSVPASTAMSIVKGREAAIKKGWKPEPKKPAGWQEIDRKSSISAIKSQAKKQFAEIFPRFKGITVAAGVKKEVVADMLNAAGKELQRMKESFPKFNDIAKGLAFKNIHIADKVKDSSNETGNGNLGNFDYKTRTLTLSSYYTTSGKQDMKISAHDNQSMVHTGKWHTCDDFQSVFRHELGHAVQGGGIPSPKWTKVTDQNGVFRTDYIKSNVSKYGSTNHYEAFAESFSAYTSPNYGKGAGTNTRLPAEFENHMKGLLG